MLLMAEVLTSCSCLELLPKNLWPIRAFIGNAFDQQYQVNFKAVLYDPPLYENRRSCNLVAPLQL